MTAFNRCFQKLMVLEGFEKYTNDPDDPGGPTKFGFSQLGYPDEDIENMTLERAKMLARRDYWLPLRCEEISDERMKFQLFESMFHMDSRRRPFRSVLIAQLALTVMDHEVVLDGKIGPQTIGALNTFRDRTKLVLMANILQMSFLLVGSIGNDEFIELIKFRLPQLRKYMYGWLRRFENIV